MTKPGKPSRRSDQSYKTDDTRGGAPGPRDQRPGKQGGKKAPPPRGRRPKPVPTNRLTRDDLGAAPAADWNVPTGDQARDAVFSHLARQVRRFPRLDLGGPDLPVSADPRDAALAHAIADAVARRWITLERLIAKKARKPLASIDAPVRAAMLAGAAQIILLDRIPAHAAVNHAVQWTKLNVNGGAAGFVNAVLHRLSEAAGPEPTTVPLPADWKSARNLIPLTSTTARPLTEDLLPEEDDKRTAVALGLPLALYSMLRDSIGEEAAINIGFAALANAPTIINVAHAKLPLDNTEHLQPHDEQGHVVYTGPRTELARLLTRRPDIWAQDPASSHTLRYAAGLGLKPTRILDLCAGLGTKTRQLAAMFPEAKIVATDTDDHRLATLAALFHGSPQVRVVRPAEVQALVDADGPFDFILLDVPCSNTGVLARRPEARHRFTREAIEGLVEVQRKIITQAAGWLAPTGGTIVYATCSLDPRENGEQVTWAASTLGLTLRQENGKGGVITLPLAEPPTAHRDGAFVAALTR
ncbi:MAG: transcription antitermination factor NusB [Phycisphaerales bacterium]